MGNSVLSCECADDARLRGNTKLDSMGRKVSTEDDNVSLLDERASGAVSARAEPAGEARVDSHARDSDWSEPEHPADEAVSSTHSARTREEAAVAGTGGTSECQEVFEGQRKERAAWQGAAQRCVGRITTCRFFTSSGSRNEFEDQSAKLVNQNGFFVALDPAAAYVPTMLEGYGHHGASSASKVELDQWSSDLRKRVATDEAFDGSRILGAVVCASSLTHLIDELPLPLYLWQVKRVVPILRIGHELSPMRRGVQLMKVPDNADQLLDDAVDAQVFGVKTFCRIGGADKKGIRSAVKQQFEFARRVIQKGLAACLQVELKPDAAQKDVCNRVLADCLLEALGELQAEERIVFDLPIPEEPNIFLPLIGHPCTMRVTGLSGGNGLAEACRNLEMNVGMVASFGRAFLEGLHLDQTPEEFTKVLRATGDAMYQASMAVPTKEVQIIKVETSDGFFVAVDETASRGYPILQRYGVPVQTFDKAELSKKLHQMRSRIFCDSKFNGSRVIGVTLSEDSMDRKVSGMPTAKYLWQEKHVVPFLRVDGSHGKEKNGVRLINDTSKLDQLLDRACSAGMFGTKARGIISLANAAGIKAVVDQQFDIARKVLAKGLVPILMPEVDINSPDKGACEELLLDALMAALQRLRPDEKVILWLTLPAKSNKYFPLIHHPNCIRLVALSGGYTRGDCCQMLKQNCGMVAGFGRAFTEDLRLSSSDQEFSKMLDEACEQVFRVSKRRPVKEEQAVKVRGQEGFFVALDQSGKNAKPIMENYGWSPEGLDSESLQAKLHAFRTRVFTQPRFNGSRVIGVLLSTDAMDRDIAGLPTAQYLWEQKKVVPFLRVDRGLQDEVDGVRLMRDIPKLGATLEKATHVGFFGTKQRNVILRPNANSIKQAVEQQFEVAKMSLQQGLVPILHIEVDIACQGKAECERILRQALMTSLRTLDKKDKVVLLLSIPTKADAFRPLMEHAQVLRVLASSGGDGRAQACDKLLENAGLVASFGRAFLDGMHRLQTDNEFSRVLNDSCDAIFQASRQRADTVGAAAAGRSSAQQRRTSEVSSRSQERRHSDEAPRAAGPGGGAAQASKLVGVASNVAAQASKLVGAASNVAAQASKLVGADEAVPSMTKRNTSGSDLSESVDLSAVPSVTKRHTHAGHQTTHDSREQGDAQPKRRWSLAEETTSLPVQTEFRRLYSSPDA